MYAYTRASAHVLIGGDTCRSTTLAGRRCVELPGEIISVAAAAYDPDLIAVTCACDRGSERKHGAILLVDLGLVRVLRQMPFDVGKRRTGGLLSFHPGGGLLVAVTGSSACA